MRLGWRNPFRGRLNESLLDLERTLTIPHLRFAVVAGQAVGATTTAMQLAPIDDPYRMMRGSEIVVPSDHGLWMALGTVGLRIQGTANAGRSLVEWGLNGGSLGAEGAREEIWRVVQPVETAGQSMLMRPVEAGATLQVRAYSNQATAIQDGAGTVMFLPLT